LIDKLFTNVVQALSAVIFEPIIIEQEKEEALLNVPPNMLEKIPEAVLPTPPTIIEPHALAVFALPPATIA
jgi:hypothetical protein